jgi:hypothetical protein
MQIKIGTNDIADDVIIALSFISIGLIYEDKRQYLFASGIEAASFEEVKV